MFKYLISINPLGFMYGSAGAFLSPENLVGRSGAKFPPEAATLSGLIFSVNKITGQVTQTELRDNLYVTGPFWAKSNNKQNFFIPIPWHKIISRKGIGEWKIENGEWQLEKDIDKREPGYRWQTIDSWETSCMGLKKSKSVADSPWKYVSFLHPKIQSQERCVEKSDGLFLENCVQIPDDVCLVYLSTYPIDNGWYRFGGENHIVEISCVELNEKTIDTFNQPIGKSFALITPGIWGSNRISYRQPQHDTFPETIRMLTDKPVSYRYRSQGTLGRGRYAVPAGSVYVLKEPINKPWWKWDEAWFPKEGYSLKKVGCGLCLPVEIKGVA
ncbi:type III-B CRISPR module-associated Cmr3 family protein [Umezakia ovalisporum]|jgi:CRISPR-associated protein Cmr3|uniref:Type III-B CRISPR module-associated protein Cmr3 n=2 Tax=Umezakia ovalisporum TaxID=75695 RepID=A0AA43KDV8_9CYAN|nr:type III-B CRISPR module-associated Cmr3 family protein [Umezakia ovalisporum]MDH6058494.1 type III-B CRISPR module-associated protein Cmr3 [Umezakia ovalisporum FSS-43]MDH6062921.1 type III-B CRISPR module-associated protein Cmr3 [Umezakia ovalisporum FSS-62]MDH6067651.1 type III-B CRISPR module-associated protein Cmr3 [Umezakia ovalisporum APH033B]MDH6069417.1 type III-B CRISPR module-associated protein Cmr3 [Umezakia ovalisporum CobakiLakeA]MDH6075455.1 type III-B CRISPR module-associate